MKAKWIFITTLIFITFVFNGFADKIFDNASLLLIIKSINSFIFGYCLGYSTLKAYLYEKENYYEL